MTIDQYIKARDWAAVRAATGLSAEKFAEEIGASVRSVFYWEQTERQPHPLFVEKMRDLDTK